MEIKGKLEVTVQGLGNITVKESDHLGTGGEGSAYKVIISGKPFVIKLYTDTDKMLRDGMPEKVALLSCIKHPNIAAPLGVVLDNKRKEPIGIMTPYGEGEVLLRCFTNAWRTQMGFTNDHANQLVALMREAMQIAHDNGAVMVDANAYNWLINSSNLKQQGPTPCAIDVDSWQIGRFQAKVIMPSIRDWHTKGFTPLSDWFSWGCVTFEIYTGIHPFKGMLDGFKGSDLEARMQQKASVFSPKVKLNHAVRDFSCIPPKLLEWYQRTMHHGERTIPPSPFDTARVPILNVVMRQVVTAQGAGMKHEKIYSESDKAMWVYPCGVIRTHAGALYDVLSKRFIATVNSHLAEVVRVENGWLVGEQKPDGTFLFRFIDEQNKYKAEEVSIQLQINRLVQGDNRLFALTDNDLTELNIIQIGKKVMLARGKPWPVLPNTLRWYNGVGVQQALQKAMFLTLPFNGNSYLPIRVKELDNLKVANAVAAKQFVAVMVQTKTGEYQRLEITFDKTYSSYTVQTHKVDTAELNMVGVPSGAVALLEEDGEIALFKPTSTNPTTKVKDKNLTTDLQLFLSHTGVVYLKDGEVWSLKSP